MAQDAGKFKGSHQESIATAIAMVDDDNSSIIANMVEVELFDPPYDDIVARCVAHRRKFKHPPGKGHIDDVFAHIFEDAKHKSTGQYDSVITKMVEQSARIDTAYVLAEVDNFMRLRKMRAGIAHAVDRYQQGGERVMDDLEEIFRQNLRIRNQARDYGFTLADPRAMDFLDRSENDYCNIGIKELDERGVVPTRGQVLAFLSPPNRGKSLFCTHCGKYALLKGWTAAHYTLENSAAMTAQRYFQTLFNGVRRNDKYFYTEFDRNDDPVTLRTQALTPDFVIENRDETVAYLTKQTKQWRDKLDNLRIREFPSGKLSFEMLEQDLDELAIAYKFVPDLLIIDMPELMKLPRSHGSEQDWSAIGTLITNIRGLAVERNMAVVVPQQGNRSSNTAKSIQAQHGAGAFKIFGVADNMITYSQTRSEEERGLARIYTQKVRNDRARMTLVITQSYDSGQFCMDSYPMTSKLRDAIRDYTGYKTGEADDDDDEYEEPRRERAR